MTLKAWLKSAPFTLVLSSGFFGFYAHTGLMLALEEAEITPGSYAGSSAGGLIAGLAGAGTPAKDVYALLRELQREDFWDPGLGAGLLKGERFRALLREILPVQRFEDAPHPIALSAFDVVRRRTEVMRGPGALDVAIAATCAFPLLLQPVWIQGRPYLDGGIKDRPGVASLRGGERVFFHHLPNSGPWRRKGSKGLIIPPHPGPMVSLAQKGLPKLHPFALERGADTITLAYESTKRALELDVKDGSQLWVDV